jgi:hypothetical protein
MKIDIVKILRETFMPEAEVDPHTNDRIRDRIIKMSDEDLPKEVKERILMVFDKIEAVDFPKKKTYVIQLGQFPVNPNSKYYKEFRGSKYYEIEGSIGNQFWVIVRNNVISTFMLATDVQTRNPEKNASRLNVDHSIGNIDKFIANQNKSKVQKEKIPMVSINGVKWVVDADNEVIYKKNKPAVKHKIIDMIDSVDDATQEAIMNFF